MKVWRVENEKGEGPYRDSENEEIINFWNDGYHPTPWADPGINRGTEKGELCAFLSEAQARRWFTVKELIALAERGYHLKEIEANITAKGTYQILIRRKQKCGVEENIFVLTAT